MKRASTYRTSAPSTSVPPPAPIEQLRFRERDGKPSAYTRLYAQGVDQLVHKDHVYQQFGLHKSPPASALQASQHKTAVAPMTAPSPLHRSNSTHVRKTPPTSQRHRSTSTTRSHSATSAAMTQRHRSNSDRFHTNHQRSGGSTRQEKRSVTGPSTTRAKPTPAVKPQRRQSAIATQLLNKTLKIGPVLIHPVSSAAVMPLSQPNGAARSPRLSMIPGSLPRRPSAAPTGPMGSPSCHQQQQHTQFQTKLDRRQSCQIASTTTRPVTAPLTSKSVGKPLTKGSPVRPTEPVVITPQPTVLVPVSRRTSSPLVIPNTTDFGMRRRPSVSPIRNGNGPSTSTVGTNGGSDPNAIGSSGHRPSILQRRDSKMDRLVEQITVLKHSLGLSDEDLQWKVESTKGNAYEAADRHLSEAEEQYDRLVYEIQLLSETPCDEASVALVKRMRELIKQNNLVAELKPTLVSAQADVTVRKKELLDARIASELQAATRGGLVDDSIDSNNSLADATKRLDEAKQRILQIQAQLTDEMTKLNVLLIALGKETDTLAAACARFRFLSPDAADVSITFLNILRCIPECAGDKLVALCEQGVQTAQKFTGSKAKELKRKEAEAEKALRDIEVWKTRKEQSKEFAIETAKREREWKQAQHEANAASLRLLRSLVPIDIQQITVDALVERARETGNVLYTYDLALYIKHNRLLHWLVTHESDVARDNFLAVECASSFLNFTAYDIHELRAVCAIMPEAFDFDKEGKKADWKRQFMEHVRLLVKQQGGETIKAGWDPARSTRADVPLKPLSDKQQLNAVYRYPTDDEIQARIDKFELQFQRLKQKKEKKVQLDAHDIPTAKSEYLAIAEDARSEELQQIFGKATLIKLRDDAKQAFQALCKTRDTLKSEIDHAERQWSAQTPSYDQFLQEAAKIKALDPEIRATRIQGPFPGELDLKPRARAAFKKLSVEEEAEARRMELTKAIADRDKGLVDESANISTASAEEAVVVVEPVTAPSPRESSTEQTSEASLSPTVTETDSSPTLDHAVSAAPVSSSVSSTEPPNFRRIKSLRVSNEVLRFLQNDFCSPRRTKSNTTLPTSEIFGTSATAMPSHSDAPTVAPLHRRRPSLPKAGEDKANTKTTSRETSVRDSMKPSEPPKPKSKAILALLEKHTQSAVPPEKNEPDKPTGMKLDFLSELKRKATGTSDTQAQKSEQADTAAPVQPHGMKLDFLSELKRKAGAKSDTKCEESNGVPTIQRPGIAKMSGQLDLFSELKSHTNKKNKEINTTTPMEDPSVAEVPTKLNFLQELVLRAKSKTSIVPADDSAIPPPRPISTALTTPPALVPTTARNFLDELKAKTLKRTSE